MKAMVALLLLALTCLSLSEGRQARFDAETCQIAFKIQKRFCDMESFKQTCPDTVAEKCEIKSGMEFF